MSPCASSPYMISGESQDQLTERCLDMIQSGKSNKPMQIGFMMLTRLLQQRTTPLPRTVQNRFGKLLVTVANDVSSSGAMMAHQLVVCSPQISQYYANVLERIMCATLDYSMPNDSEARSFFCALFAELHNTELSEKLFATVEYCLNGDVTAACEGIFDISCIGKREHHEAVIESMIVALTLLVSKTENTILPFGRTMMLIERSLRFSPASRRAAFELIVNIVRNADSAFLSLLSGISSTLISFLDEPSVGLYGSLRVLVEQHGIGAKLHEHAFALYSSFGANLHEKIEYAMAAAELFSSLLWRTSHLISAEVLLAIQRDVCEKCLKYPMEPVYERMLTTLLSSLNEAIPRPVNVVHTLLQRGCVLYNELSILADCSSRPLIEDYSASTVRRQRAIERAEEVSLLNGSVASFSRMESRESRKRINILMNEPTQTPAEGMQSEEGLVNPVVYDDPNTEQSSLFSTNSCERQNTAAVLPSKRGLLDDGEDNLMESSMGAPQCKTNVLVTSVENEQTTVAVKAMQSNVAYSNRDLDDAVTPMPLKMRKIEPAETKLDEGELSVDDILSCFNA